MKLQYLGDARDSFKWDLLHYVATESVPHFEELHVVPMLTGPDSRPHGNTPPEWFDCRPQILPFVHGLREEPRNLENIVGLGQIPGLAQLHVTLHHPERSFADGATRQAYFADLAPQAQRSIVFLDPDTGLGPTGRAGTTRVGFDEATEILESLNEESVLAIFQYRPRVRWPDLFARIEGSLGQVPHLCAIHEANLAFVFLARSQATFNAVVATLNQYVQEREHPLALYARVG